MPCNSKQPVTDEQQVLDLVESMCLEKAAVVVNMLTARIQQRQNEWNNAPGKNAPDKVEANKHVTFCPIPTTPVVSFGPPREHSRRTRYNKPAKSRKPGRAATDVILPPARPRPRKRKAGQPKKRRSRTAAPKTTPGGAIPPSDTAPILPAVIPHAPTGQRVQLGSVSTEDDGSL